MKWTKLPSCSEDVLRQLNSIKGVDKITNGVEIAYYLLLPSIKRKRRRKNGKPNKY